MEGWEEKRPKDHIEHLLEEDKKIREDKGAKIRNSSEG